MSEKSEKKLEEILTGGLIPGAPLEREIDRVLGSFIKIHERIPSQAAVVKVFSRSPRFRGEKNLQARIRKLLSERKPHYKSLLDPYGMKKMKRESSAMKSLTKRGTFLQVHRNFRPGIPDKKMPSLSSMNRIRNLMAEMTQAAIWLQTFSELVYSFMGTCPALVAMAPLVSRRLLFDSVEGHEFEKKLALSRLTGGAGVPKEPVFIQSKIGTKIFYRINPAYNNSAGGRNLKALAASCFQITILKEKITGIGEAKLERVDLPDLASDWF